MDHPQDMAGRTCLVTGANTGIGRVTALELARRGARVWLAGRSRERLEPVVAEIRAQCGAERADLLELDLSSQASVRAGAATWLATGEPLHVLVNNAGLAGARGVTREGFEQTFGVNHLGHYLLTRLLLDRLLASAPARVVNVSSQAHYSARTIDFDALRQRTPSTTGLPEYAVSKLANVLFAAELQRRYGSKGLVAVALHPGVIASDVWRQIPWPVRPLIKLFMKSNEDGALTSLHCATSAEVARDPALYYDKSRPKKASAPARDAELAAQLWRRSAEWTGLAS